MDDIQESKSCSVCKRILPITDFYIRRDRMKPISRCKSCNHELTKRSYSKLSKEEKATKLAYRADWFSKQAMAGNLKPLLQHKITGWKHNAERDGVPFNITVNYLIELFNEQKGKCYYTGELLVLKTSGGRGQKTMLSNSPNQISLDRKIPKKGYVVGNVVWCTYLINTCKNSLVEDDFYKVCKIILEKKGMCQECQDEVFH